MKSNTKIGRGPNSKPLICMETSFVQVIVAIYDPVDEANGVNAILIVVKHIF
jgi:hypothetical protein